MPGTSKVAIVVDSAASLPEDINTGDRSPLFIVPMQFIIDGKTYLDGMDLTPTEFYRLLSRMEELPTTSGPSPASFLKTFQTAATQASFILCLTVSPHFSSTYDSARTAVDDAKRMLPHTQIRLLDTESAAGGEGLIVMEAWRVAHRGGSLQDVTAAAEAVIKKVSLFAFLDTLFYVWKGGRVPRLAYLGTSLLQIKPIFEMSRGEVHNVARTRTTWRAADRLLGLIHERVGSSRIHAAVMHADAREAADQLYRRIKTEFSCDELFVSEFSPVMGTHIGPGLLGVAFWSDIADRKL